MKKKQLYALAAVAVIAGIGGTFAYFNQTLTATNVFDTGTYDTELVEKFKPSDGDNWEPGSKVNKDVTVKNTGTLPVVVRVKFEEVWEREGEQKPVYQIDTTINKEKLAVGSPSEARNKFENVYQGDPEDGLAGEDRDDSVVFKEMMPDGGWVYNADDGYYYYTKVLAGVEKDGSGAEIIDETTKLLDSVTLSENVDMGAYKETKFYALTKDEPKDSKDWIEFATDSEAKYVSTREMKERLAAEGKEITYMKSITDQLADKKGYSNADYTLIVTAQTVQATEQAVKTAFGDLDKTKLGLGWTLLQEGTEK